ncbi:hypothetical protein Taro_017064 [Colocasia esculenta]|uniref:Uncharacterized protein n=1 Tax=Colocasia esculenta TaxID=4460 RepID=A0A843UY96_COLES|nr:hypothetical protein [Colocasia esculenta]
MTVLGRRLAGTEGAYFLQESKNAAGRLAAAQQKKKAAANGKGELNLLPSIAKHAVGKEHPLVADSADVLPEILRHSIPLRYQDEMPPSSFSRGSKWNLSNDPASSLRLDGVINPLKDYVSFPQVTFGPKRWQLPDAQSSVLASTANELRRDRYPQPINSEKLKAAAAGLSQSRCSSPNFLFFGCWSPTT